MEIEFECEKVYRLFDERCCLDWDKKDILFEAHRKALRSLERLKNVLRCSISCYEKYRSKINECYEMMMIKGESMIKKFLKIFIF